MRLSKIGALGTYHKCIRQLQEFGYIIYEPSFNPYKGSLVHLHNFDGDDGQRKIGKHIKKRTTSAQEQNGQRVKTDTGIGQALIPSINNTNLLNSKHSRSTQNNSSEENESTKFENKKLESENWSQKKCGEPIPFENFNQQKVKSGVSVILNGAPRSEESHSVKFRPPTLSEIQMYFAEKDALPEEAEKFFNHYESNGWLVGGKAKMKNWQAAARNWLLNSKKFNPQSSGPVPKTTHLHATTTKSYQEKL